MSWYWRRIDRIYPSLILAVLILTLIFGNAFYGWRIIDYIKTFVWPTPYWFISALMPFYVVFFLLMKLKRSQIFLVAIGVLAIPYLYFYLTTVNLSLYSIEGPGYFKWIFYLQVMLFGGYLASSNHEINKTGKNTRYFVLLIGCIVFYYGILLLVTRGYGEKFQALTHVLMFPMMYFFIKVSISDFITNNLVRRKYIGFFVWFIGNLTIEIYLLHGAVYSHPIIQDISFPMNMVFFWVSVIVTSYILKSISSFLTHKYPTVN